MAPRFLPPEKISIGRELPAADCANRFQGKVFDYLYTGDVTLYIVEVEGELAVRRLKGVGVKMTSTDAFEAISRGTLDGAIPATSMVDPSLRVTWNMARADFLAATAAAGYNNGAGVALTQSSVNVSLVAPGAKLLDRQNQARSALRRARPGEGGLGGGAAVDPEAEVVQPRSQERAGRVVRVDDEGGSAAQCVRQLGQPGWFDAQMHRKGEATALARRAANLDMPAHEGHQLVGDGEAEAGAAVAPGD